MNRCISRRRCCICCCPLPICCCLPIPPPPSPVPPPVFNVFFAKTNAQTGLPLAGASFELIQNGRVVAMAESGPNGQVDLGAFSPGLYTLREVTTPSGFDPLPPATLIISENGNVTINDEPTFNPVTNTPAAPLTATIIVEHIDSETGALLERDVFIVSPGAYGPFAPGAFPEYTFVGLAPGSAPASGTILAGETITIIFTYQAVPQTFTVTYFPNGGVGAINVITVSANAFYTITDQGYTRFNYLFTDWNTSPDGSGTSYFNGQSIFVSGDIALYAQWIPFA